MYARLSATLAAAIAAALTFAIPAHADVVSCADAEAHLTVTIAAERASARAVLGAQAATYPAPWVDGWRRVGSASYAELVAQADVRQARVVVAEACRGPVYVAPVIPAPPPIVVVAPVDPGIAVRVHLPL